MNTRPGPNDRQAEEALLGACLIPNSPALEAVLALGLNAGHFYHPNNGHLFTAITKVTAAGDPVDVVTVLGHLALQGLADQIGGQDRLLGLTEDCPSTTNAHTYALRVIHASRHRSTMQLAKAIYNCAQSNDDPSASVGQLADMFASTSAGDPAGRALSRVDWPSFWQQDRSASDWAVEPLWPRARATNVYAARGTGKSELLLYGAIGLATGRSVLSQPSAEPRPVLYLDLEMTEEDLYDRLVDFGLSADDDLSHLAYYLLPDLPPLNTPEGGSAVLDLVGQHRAELVVVDTMARATSGEENSNDLYRALATNTIAKLKAAGVTSVWSGHAGKDPTKGERGGSAKADFVDCVWELTRGSGGSVRLANKKRRSSWIPQTVHLQRATKHGIITYTVATDSWSAGTEEAATRLDQLEAPPDITRRDASDLLRRNGHRARNEVISSALRWRRAKAEETCR